MKHTKYFYHQDVVFPSKSRDGGKVIKNKQTRDRVTDFLKALLSVRPKSGYPAPLGSPTKWQLIGVKAMR